MQHHDHSRVIMLSVVPAREDISLSSRVLIVLLIAVSAAALLAYNAFLTREARELKAFGKVVGTPVAESPSAGR